MTPTILVPFTDGVQLEFVHTLGGKVCTNRIWLWNFLGPNDQARIDTLAATAASWWESNIMALLSSDLVLVLVRASDWSNPLSPIVGAVFPNVAGSISSPSQSANVAVRVSFRWPINIHLKPNGNFLCGIPDNAVSINNVELAFASAVFEAYVRLIDDVRTWEPAFTWLWVCVSLVHNNVNRLEVRFAECIGPTVVTPFVTQQRHRLRV